MIDLWLFRMNAILTGIVQATPSKVSGQLHAQLLRCDIQRFMLGFRHYDATFFFHILPHF